MFHYLDYLDARIDRYYDFVREQTRWKLIFPADSFAAAKGLLSKRKVIEETAGYAN